MIPAYRSMDSFPYQRNQTPFLYYYHPGIDATPPQIKMDPSKPPFSYEPYWPYAGTYGHPMPPHFCCGHSYYPGYYSFRPSYPRAPAPMYYSGGCPSFGEPFVVPYPPQSHYTMELPRYEYDKHMPQHHCCGCPSHPCNKKEDRSLKIEEHEPDGEKKVNDVSVPTQFKNFPFPLIWVPPEYTTDKQLKGPNTAEVFEQDKTSGDRKPPNSEESRVWNGWLPFDKKDVPNVFHDGYGMKNKNEEGDNSRRESEDGRMDQKQQNDHKKSQFPFPIFWLPYYNKQEESGRTNNQEHASSPKIIEEVPHAFKSVPVKSHVDEGSDRLTFTNTCALDDAKKVTNARSIPVKQIELQQGKNNSEGISEIEMNVSPNQVQENVTKKESGTGEKKRQSKSPPKASKLPPVCLRVDPLPRKKNGNGRSSRSPSPPSSKQHSQAVGGETSKTPSCRVNDNKAQSNSDILTAGHTSEKVEPKVRTIQVSESKTSENKGADSKEGCQSQMNVSTPNVVPTGAKENFMNGDKYKTEDQKAEKGAEKMMEETTEQNDVKDSNVGSDMAQKEKRVLSDADAAVLIQAVYRGYLVRKWELLKKLKQIDEIRKEVTDVRGHVQAFESSSNFQNDDKQKTAIGENIMRLLLKLDTIQGLHPSFREIRKSLARELTTLQERLDSIKKPQQQMQDFEILKPVEVPPSNTKNENYAQEKQTENMAASRDSYEGIGDDIKSPCANDDRSESQSPVDGSASDEGMKAISQRNGLDDKDNCEVPTLDGVMKSTSHVSEPERMPVEVEVKSEVHGIPIEVDNDLDMTICEELPVAVIDEDTNILDTEKDEHEDVNSERLQAKVDESRAVEVKPCTPIEVDNNLDMTICEEFPVGVIDQDTNILDALKDEREDVRSESLQAKVDSKIHAMMELPVGLLDEDEKDDEPNSSKEKALVEHADWIEELPVQLLDEDTAKSEVDEAETHDEVVRTEEMVYDDGKKTSSFTDNTVKEIQLEQPQLEEHEEVQSSAESDGWIKIDYQKEDELREHEPMVTDSNEELGSDIKLRSLTRQVNDHELGRVEADDTQKEGKETQVEDNETETSAPEKTEQFAAAQMVGEHEGELNGDPKLLEENEKLRKMMKKLLEAGNEQLSVISDLTGRVKELEKKLARSRSKRVKTKRYRTAASKM